MYVTARGQLWDDIRVSRGWSGRPIIRAHEHSFHLTFRKRKSYSVQRRKTPAECESMLMIMWRYDSNQIVWKALTWYRGMEKELKRLWKGRAFSSKKKSDVMMKCKGIDMKQMSLEHNSTGITTEVLHLKSLSKRSLQEHIKITESRTVWVNYPDQRNRSENNGSEWNWKKS